MNGKTMSPELHRLYLLGELDPEARERVEERLMLDAEAYEELMIAEDELIDRYLGGRLDERERESFLQHFLLTPGRRQKLDFARTFRAYVADHAGRPSAAASGGPE